MVDRVPSLRCGEPRRRGRRCVRARSVARPDKLQPTSHVAHEGERPSIAAAAHDGVTRFLVVPERLTELRDPLSLEGSNIAVDSTDGEWPLHSYVRGVASSLESLWRCARSNEKCRPVVVVPSATLSSSAPQRVDNAAFHGRFDGQIRRLHVLYTFGMVRHAWRVPLRVARRERSCAASSPAPSTATKTPRSRPRSSRIRSAALESTYSLRRRGVALRRRMTPPQTVLARRVWYRVAADFSPWTWRRA